MYSIKFQNDFQISKSFVPTNQSFNKSEKSKSNPNTITMNSKQQQQQKYIKKYQDFEMTNESNLKAL